MVDLSGSNARSGLTFSHRRAVLCWDGVAHLVYAWSQRGAGAILWQILIGIVYVVAALYMLVLPVAGVVALTLVLAFYIAAEGCSNSSSSLCFDGCVERPGSLSTV